MSEDIEQLFRNIVTVWQAAASKGDYEQLLDLSFSGRQIFKALKQDEAAEACLGTLHIAISHLWKETGSKASVEINDAKQNECSFCGRRPPGVRLGAGPAVFICNECAETFSKIFAEENER
ncbi:MAG: ClpX C4-type zinc finger protein [Roseiarcus sp.]|jgi:RNA polymerase-binding transcription factor DksA